MSDLEAVPNPVIHSCQILDPGRDVRRIEIVSEELKRGRQMGYSRSKIVDADQPDRVLALTQGQGISIGTPPQGLERMEANPLEVVDSPDLPPLWQVFGGHRRDDGHWALPELAVEVASPDAALHIGPQFVILETAAIDAAAEHRRHRPRAGRVVARDVPGPRQGRSVPGRNRTDARRRRHGRRPRGHVRRGRRRPDHDGGVVPVPYRPYVRHSAMAVAIARPKLEGNIAVGDDRQIGFAEFGDPQGRAIFWLHGTPGARRQIPMEARVYAEERQIRLIGVDRPGIGSSTPFQYDTVFAFAEDLRTIADTLGIDKFEVIGLSGGGPYTLACAAAMPDRVVAAGVLGGVAPVRGADGIAGGVIDIDFTRRRR